MHRQRQHPLHQGVELIQLLTRGAVGNHLLPGCGHDDDLPFRFVLEPCAGGNKAAIVTRMSERFYINCPLAPGLIHLHGPEAHHLGTVCRLRPGDQVCLFNGDGHQYPARVINVTRKQVELEVYKVEFADKELPFKLEVAAPLPKGDRAQFLLEKLTELGVSHFVPLQTKRSVIHPGDNKLEKLERYVIEASKQCGRNVLLRVEPLIAWEMYSKKKTLPELRIMAHVHEAPISHFAKSGIAIAVGPEGGFTDDEAEDAQRNGWQLVGLGPRMLRVETAALMMVAAAIFGVHKNPIL